MKTELKVKFIQTLLNKKKEDEGFTLIELLVVIIIIGILSAIALPSFLNQANKAKQSEAQTYVGSLNRAQQAYYAENNVFADNDRFADLGLGASTDTTNYKYVIKDGGNGKEMVSNQAQTVNAKGAIKAFVGGVALSTIGGAAAGTSKQATTIARLCVGDDAPFAGGPTGTDAFKDAASVALTPDKACDSLGKYAPVVK